MELLVVMAALAVLSATSIQALNLTTRRNSLDAQTNVVVTELNKARSLTLASKNATQYGIHFASSSVTLFEGASYAAGSASNTVTRLPSDVSITSAALAGGGSDIVFERLSGETSQYGTTTLTATFTGNQRNIVVFPTGLTESK